MWGCNCRYIHANGTSRIKPHKTEVFQDETCVSCGYYALWITDSDEMSNTTTTSVINKKTLKITIYPSIMEAAAGTKVKYENIGSSDEFQKRLGYFPKNSDFCFIKGTVKEVSEDKKFRIKKETIYIYNREGAQLGVVKTSVEAKKITNDSTDAILSNLRRETFFTKRGFVYSHNSNLCVKNFAELQRQYRIQEIS